MNPSDVAQGYGESWRKRYPPRPSFRELFVESMKDSFWIAIYVLALTIIWTSGHTSNRDS